MEINDGDYSKLSKQLSEEEIIKYVSGELSPSEMHNIELLLLDKSIETDAVEGLATIKNRTELEGDLTEIQRRIKERVSKSEKLFPVKPIKVWRYNPINIAVAAAVSVLSVLAVTLFFLKIDFFNRINTNSVKPSPVGGLSNYSIYIKNNLVCPEKESTNNKISVFVNFIIKSDGSLSDFKIIKSNGDQYDNEAIRLVKNGPKWKPGKKGNKYINEDYTLKIDFDCQKK